MVDFYHSIGTAACSDCPTLAVGADREVGGVTSCINDLLDDGATGG